MFRKVLTLVAVSLLWCVGSESVWARQSMELEQRLRECTTVVKSMMEAADGGIPAELLNRSRAIIIFPSLLKAGLGLGGHYGKGVILARHAKTDKWGPPAFLSMMGGSIGWQLGIQATDLVILVMNRVNLQAVFKDKFTIGADASIAAGPVGREASAGTDISLQAGMLSYSRSKGLFAGVSIKGTILEPDWNANETYYGSDASLIDVFFQGKGQVSAAGRELIRVLNAYTAGRRK
ncbi:MAG: lipid-binding SYLF domain-containing protein [Thermodesulfobacteriota bacterium]